MLFDNLSPRPIDREASKYFKASTLCLKKEQNSFLFYRKFCSTKFFLNLQKFGKLVSQIHVWLHIIDLLSSDRNEAYLLVWNLFFYEHT